MLMAWVLLCVTGACHARRPGAPATVRYVVALCDHGCIKEAVEREAEPGAVDCGWGSTYERWSAITSCVLKAEAEGRPFRAFMKLQGIDSEIIAGYVRKADGTRWEFWFDSDGTGSGRPGNASVTRRPCERLLQDPEPARAALLKCETPGERVPAFREGETWEIVLGPVVEAKDVFCPPEDHGKERMSCWRDEGRGNLPAGLSLVCMPWGGGGRYLACTESSRGTLPFPPGLEPEAEREPKTK
jgi:hypothetical protein